MRQRDAKHTLRKSPFVRRTTPRSSGTVACWPTRVLLLCLYLVVFYYAFPKNARPSPSRLGFFRRFFRKGAKSRGKQNIRSDVPLFSGTPDWSRTSGLTLRRENVDCRSLSRRVDLSRYLQDFLKVRVALRRSESLRVGSCRYLSFSQILAKSAFF